MLTLRFSIVKQHFVLKNVLPLHIVIAINKMERITIRDKFDKTLIAKLPKEAFEGRIIVIQTEREAANAVDYLLTCSILGIDTETRPTFRKGPMNKVALLQVATEDTCFLFRLNMMGLSPSIIRLLQNTSVPKVGLSLKDDLLQLSHRGEFTPGIFIDIQKEVKEIGIVDMSLQKIFANLFGKRISKSQQLSNWEADILSDAQKKYAATDAWACVLIHKRIEEMKSTSNFELIKNEIISQ